jgi:predicted phage tail component-like protein
MAIRSSLYFIFNGEKSTDYGIYNVSVSSGMYDEPFIANRNISEVKIRGKDKPFYTTVTNDPLQFQLTFAIQDSFDSNKLRAIARWLTTSYYKPLQFSDNLDRVYYALLTSDSHLIHTGSNGYITVNFRCDSPYSYSPVIESPVYDLSSNPANGTTIQFNNTGDLSVLPEMWIDKVGFGEFEIINMTNGGTSTKFAYTPASPTVAPVLSTSANSSSTLPAATYYVRFTWSSANGETLVSPETSMAVASGNNLVVTIPTLPTGGTLANIYISTSSGTETKQGTTIATTYIQSTPLVSGSSPPTTMTTGLYDGETVYVDGNNEYIQSDQANVFRYTNFSNSFLTCVYGVNNLLVLGTCRLRFRFQYIYLQG